MLICCAMPPELVHLYNAADIVSGRPEWIKCFYVAYITHTLMSHDVHAYCKVQVADFHSCHKTVIEVLSRVLYSPVPRCESVLHYLRCGGGCGKRPVNTSSHVVVVVTLDSSRCGSVLIIDNVPHLHYIKWCPRIFQSTWQTHTQCCYYC